MVFEATSKQPKPVRLQTSVITEEAPDKVFHSQIELFAKFRSPTRLIFEYHS